MIMMEMDEDKDISAFISFYSKKGLSDPFKLSYGKTTLGSSLDCDVRVKGEDDIFCVLDCNKDGVTTLCNLHEDARIVVNGNLAKMYNVLRNGDHFQVGTKRFKYINTSTNEKNLKAVELAIKKNMEHNVLSGGSFNPKKRFSLVTMKHTPKGFQKRSFPNGSTSKTVETPVQFPNENRLSRRANLDLSTVSSSVSRVGKLYSGNLSDASEVTTPENYVSVGSITPLNVLKKTSKSNRMSTHSVTTGEIETPKSAIKSRRSSMAYRPLVENITPVSPSPKSTLRFSSLKKPSFRQRRSVNFNISSSSENSENGLKRKRNSPNNSTLAETKTKLVKTDSFNRSSILKDVIEEKFAGDDSALLGISVLSNGSPFSGTKDSTFKTPSKTAPTTPGRKSASKMNNSVNNFFEYPDSPSVDNISLSCFDVSSKTLDNSNRSARFSARSVSRAGSAKGVPEILINSTPFIEISESDTSIDVVSSTPLRLSSKRTSKSLVNVSKSNTSGISEKSRTISRSRSSMLRKTPIERSSISSRSQNVSSDVYASPQGTTDADSTFEFRSANSSRKSGAKSANTSLSAKNVSGGNLNSPKNSSMKNASGTLSNSLLRNSSKKNESSMKIKDSIMADFSDISGSSYMLGHSTLANLEESLNTSKTPNKLSGSMRNANKSTRNTSMGKSPGKTTGKLSVSTSKLNTSRNTSISTRNASVKKSPGKYADLTINSISDVSMNTSKSMKRSKSLSPKKTPARDKDLSALEAVALLANVSMDSSLSKKRSNAKTSRPTSRNKSVSSKVSETSMSSLNLSSGSIRSQAEPSFETSVSKLADSVVSETPGKALNVSKSVSFGNLSSKSGRKSLRSESPKKTSSGSSLLDEVSGYSDVEESLNASKTSNKSSSKANNSVSSIYGEMTRSKSVEKSPKKTPAKLEVSTATTSSSKKSGRKSAKNSAETSSRSLSVENLDDSSEISPAKNKLMNTTEGLSRSFKKSLSPKKTPGKGRNTSVSMDSSKKQSIGGVKTPRSTSKNKNLSSKVADESLNLSSTKMNKSLNSSKTVAVLETSTRDSSKSMRKSRSVSPKKTPEKGRNTSVSEAVSNLEDASINSSVVSKKQSVGGAKTPRSTPKNKSISKAAEKSRSSLNLSSMKINASQVFETSELDESSTKSPTRWNVTSEELLNTTRASSKSMRKSRSRTPKKTPSMRADLSSSQAASFLENVSMNSSKSRRKQSRSIERTSRVSAFETSASKNKSVSSIAAETSKSSSAKRKKSLNSTETDNKQTSTKRLSKSVTSLVSDTPNMSTGTLNGSFGDVSSRSAKTPKRSTSGMKMDESSPAKTADNLEDSRASTSLRNTSRNISRSARNASSMENLDDSRKSTKRENSISIINITSDVSMNTTRGSAKSKRQSTSVSPKKTPAKNLSTFEASSVLEINSINSSVRSRKSLDDIKTPRANTSETSSRNRSMSSIASQTLESNRSTINDLMTFKTPGKAAPKTPAQKSILKTRASVNQSLENSTRSNFLNSIPVMDISEFDSSIEGADDVVSSTPLKLVKTRGAGTSRSAWLNISKSNRSINNITALSKKSLSISKSRSKKSSILLDVSKTPTERSSVSSRRSQNVSKGVQDTSKQSTSSFRSRRSEKSRLILEAYNNASLTNKNMSVPYLKISKSPAAEKASKTLPLFETKKNSSWNVSEVSSSETLSNSRRGSRKQSLVKDESQNKSKKGPSRSVSFMEASGMADSDALEASSVLGGAAEESLNTSKTPNKSRRSMKNTSRNISKITAESSPVKTPAKLEISMDSQASASLRNISKSARNTSQSVDNLDDSHKRTPAKQNVTTEVLMNNTKGSASIRKSRSLSPKKTPARGKNASVLEAVTNLENLSMNSSVAESRQSLGGAKTPRSTSKNKSISSKAAEKSRLSLNLSSAKKNESLNSTKSSAQKVPETSTRDSSISMRKSRSLSPKKTPAKSRNSSVLETSSHLENVSMSSSSSKRKQSLEGVKTPKNKSRSSKSAEKSRSSSNLSSAKKNDSLNSTKTETKRVSGASTFKNLSKSMTSLMSKTTNRSARASLGSKSVTFGDLSANASTSSPHSPLVYFSPSSDSKSDSVVRRSVRTPRSSLDEGIYELSELRRSISNSSVSSNEVQKSSRESTGALKGAKKQVQKSPRNDLTEIVGVKKLMKTPRAQNPPKNDLTHVVGVKSIFRTPQVPKSPKNDLSKVVGVKKLMGTPKEQNPPKNDLTRVSGVKSIFRTPKDQKSPKNDLTQVVGVKKLMNTPKVQNPPENDLTRVAGVKSIFRTPKNQKSPKNDLTKVVGVKKLMGTPKEQKAPKNDLTRVSGVKSIFRTPKNQKAPKNDLTNVAGVKKLMSTPKVVNEPKNDLTDVRGVASLFKERKSRNSNILDRSNAGLDLLFAESKDGAFNDVSNKKPLRTYERSPRKNENTSVVGESVLEWVEDQAKLKNGTQKAAASVKTRKKGKDEKEERAESTQAVQGGRGRRKRLLEDPDSFDTTASPTIEKKEETPAKTRKRQKKQDDDIVDISLKDENRTPVKAAGKDEVKVTRTRKTRKVLDEESKAKQEEEVKVPPTKRARRVLGDADGKKKQGKEEESDGVDKLNISRESTKNSRGKSKKEDSSLNTSLKGASGKKQVSFEDEKAKDKTKKDSLGSVKSPSIGKSEVSPVKTRKRQRAVKDDKAVNEEISPVKVTSKDEGKKTQAKKGRKALKDDSPDDSTSHVVEKNEVSPVKTRKRQRVGKDDKTTNGESTVKVEEKNEAKKTQARKGRKAEKDDSLDDSSSHAIEKSEVSPVKTKKRLRKVDSDKIADESLKDETDNNKESKVTQVKRGRKVSNENSEVNQETVKVARTRRARNKTEEADSNSNEQKEVEIPPPKRMRKSLEENQESKAEVKKKPVNKKRVSQEESDEDADKNDVSVEATKKVSARGKSKKAEEVGNTSPKGKTKKASSGKTSKKEEVTKDEEDKSSSSRTKRKVVVEETQDDEKTDEVVKNKGKSKSKENNKRTSGGKQASKSKKGDSEVVEVEPLRRSKRNRN